MKLQSVKGSTIEVGTNLMFGILTGWLTNMILLPCFGFNVKSGDSLIIVLVFTAISFARGFIVRRFFNYIQLRQMEES